MEILLGLPPMNQLDAAAPPIDIFRDEADLKPYQAVLPEVALDNLYVPPAKDARTAWFIQQTEKQNLSKPDQADVQTLNEIIWYSVRGDSYPRHRIARLPAFDLMLIGLRKESEEEAAELKGRIVMRRDLR